MSEDEDDLAALKEQTSHGDRIEEAAAEDERQAFVDQILTELDAIESGETQKTISVWDGPLAAYIRALEQDPDRMEAVGRALQRELDVPEKDIDRSTLLRLALRLGFKDAAPQQFEAIREAIQEQAVEQL